MKAGTHRHHAPRRPHLPPGAGATGSRSSSSTRRATSGRWSGACRSRSRRRASRRRAASTDDPARGAPDGGRRARRRPGSPTPRGRPTAPAPPTNATAVSRRAGRSLPARGDVAVPRRHRRRRRGPGLVAQRRLDRRLVAVARPQRLQRRRLLPGQHERLRGLVPPGLHAAGRRVRPLRAQGQPALDHPLRVGELPRHRVAERPRDRQPRRRLRAVRARPSLPASRREPADRAGRQPPHAGRPPARAGRPVVELRRDPARGVPARGADRRPLAGADPDASPLPAVRGDDPGAGARAQRDRRAPEGAPARHVRARRDWISARRRSRRGGDLDRERHRAGPASQPVGARASQAVRRDAGAVGLARAAPRRLLHLERDPDDQGHARRPARAQRAAAQPARREPARADASGRRRDDRRLRPHSS